MVKKMAINKSRLLAGRPRNRERKKRIISQVEVEDSSSGRAEIKKMESDRQPYIAVGQGCPRKRMDWMEQRKRSFSKAGSHTEMIARRGTHKGKILEQIPKHCTKQMDTCSCT